MGPQSQWRRYCEFAGGVRVLWACSRPPCGHSPSTPLRRSAGALYVCVPFLVPPSRWRLAVPWVPLGGGPRYLEPIAALF
eukprot:8502573-Alexandrium_andersonii.AAC.1